MDANSEDEFVGKSPLEIAIDSYCDCVQNALIKRWRAAGFEPYHTEKYEVIFGLLSRQATLSIELSRNPSIWTGHVAPLILRAMTDAHITLQWILEDIDKRVPLYIEYGLGQEKLNIENLKAKLKEEPNEELSAFVRASEDWVNAEKAMYLTDINLGSWSGKNTRDMAIEGGCEELYKFAYSGFSAAVHNTWPHIARYNLEVCKNPIHKYHRAPMIFRLIPDLDYAYRSAKYVEKSFKAVDTKLGITVNAFDVRAFFLDVMDSVPGDNEEQ